MANVINGTDSGQGGLITTGDSSDELQLQTAETTAVTITSGQQSAFIAGTASAPAVTTTGDLNTGIFFPAADNIGFATDGVIRGRWTTDGLCFGSDTAAANALDDYEEGTWTPSLTFGGAAVALTYSSRFGFYTKIGNQVTIIASINLTNKGTSTGGAVIGGLPFTIGNVTGNNPVSVVQSDFLTFGTGYLAYFAPTNGTSFNPYLNATGAVGTQLTETAFANSTTIRATFSYFV